MQPVDADLNIADLPAPLPLGCPTGSVSMDEKIAANRASSRRDRHPIALASGQFLHLIFDARQNWQTGPGVHARRVTGSLLVVSALSGHWPHGRRTETGSQPPSR